VKERNARHTSWGAVVKARSIVVATLMLFTLVVMTPSSIAQPEEMNLEGRVFLWDDTPLQGLPWEDSTPFAVWVFHDGAWNRFPSAGWVLTNGGWYAYTLEAGDRDVLWSNGDAYRVQLDATAFGGLNTNATSHGTGDPGEFPPFGELENVIMWSDPDNSQQWDVVVPIPDLQPNAMAVDGIEYPGPYDPLVPVGPIVVLPGTSHVVEANVTNAGAPLIRILNTASLDDSCGAFEHVGEIQQIGPGSSAPPGTRFSAIWTAPALPFLGDCLLNYTVDFYDNVTEYDEGNNSASILFTVEAPDLSPVDVLIETPSGNFYYPDPSATDPPFHSDVVPSNPGDSVTISMNASNAGGYETGAQFNVVMANTGNVSGGPPVAIHFNSGEVGPLLAGGEIGPFVTNFQIPNETGYHCLNLTVDFGIDGTGNITESSEANNTFVVCFGVDVPDLTPYDIAIELEDGSVFTYLDASSTGYTSDPIYVFPGDLLNITSSVRNVGVFPSPVGIQTQLGFYYVGDDPLNSIHESIAEWSNVPPLSPGSTSGPYVSLGYSVPFDLGNRYINITVDNESQIQESNEANNTFTVHLVVGGPDLIPSRVNLTVDGIITEYPYPQSPTVEVDISSAVDIEALITNQGNFGTNGSFSTEFADDTNVFHANMSGSLGTGEGIILNSSWVNPGVPSLHVITIATDSADEIAEVNESNNVFTLTLVVKGPDLIPANVSVSVSGKSSMFQYSDSPVGPVIVDISEDVRMNVTILNQGGLPAGAFRVGFLEDAQLFSMSGMLGPLNSSSTISLSNIPWPNPGVLGDFSVTVSTDHLDSVLEVSEDNNVFEILFRIVGPDIVAFDLLVDGSSPGGPVGVTGGETVLITGVAFNSGTNATPQSFSVSIYNASERDSPLSLLSVSQLMPGEYRWHNITWSAPMDYLTTTIVFEVDRDDDVFEINEENNLLETILVVTPLPPDLRPVDPEIGGLPYEGPHLAQAGEVLLLSAFVENVGNYTTGGPFDNAFYNGTASLFPFAISVEGTLIPGRITAEIEVLWKAPKKAGTYNVTFHVDYLNSIPEANESNNQLRFVIEVLETEEEINWKPLLALVFALVLALLGILIGYMRPLDRFVPRPKGLPDEEISAYRKQMRGQPVGEKLGTLDQDSLLRKFSRDRIFTIAVLAIPLPTLELVIAVLSLVLGILRVPEDGNWISVGLIANLIVLVVGISVDMIVSKKGYGVPSEVLAPPEPDAE
jgi:subtilase family serine protease